MNVRPTVRASRFANTLDAAKGTSVISVEAPDYGIDFVDGGFSVQRQENRTGMPDNLKTGIESLSGISMDNVRVHYNSSKPAQLQALAYTQGPEIHVGPGQDRHLPHEAWHVVQQKQGRVKETTQAKRVSINDDAALEREADAMGAKAYRMEPGDRDAPSSAFRGFASRQPSEMALDTSRPAIQARFKFDDSAGWQASSEDPSIKRNLDFRAVNLQGRTGSPGRASTFVRSEQGQTKPADLNRMEKWKKMKLLRDPSVRRAQTLARMHAINGTFGGPSEARNMFLGTAASNNFAQDSHLHQVEEPIRDFLKQRDPESLGVDYSVSPGFGVFPTYMAQRITGIPDPTDRRDFTAWALEGVPATYHCDATFYRQGKNGVEEATQSENLIADLGAPGAGSAAVAAVVGENVGELRRSLAELRKEAHVLANVDKHNGPRTISFYADVVQHGEEAIPLLRLSHISRLWVALEDPLRSKLISALNQDDSGIVNAVATGVVA